ncbi:MAG TPA: Crp/Fnr family transcriptional regulator [Mycobacteriales bacterium]|nr:Crp/Fnr family transcriptional regulator [Mycobacteriales bacterium]
MNPAAVHARDFAATELFGGCAEEMLARLQSMSRARSLKRHQILFAQGDPVDSLVIVRSGRLKVFSTSSNGDELLLAIADSGETLGEVAVFDAGERSATVEAMEPSEVVLVPRQEVIAALKADPALSHRLQVRIAAVARRLTTASTDLAYVDLPRRLAKVLISQTTTGAPGRGLSQSDFASLVGGSRQAVNAAFAGFERRGWITREGGRVVSLDQDALRRFADS